MTQPSRDQQAAALEREWAQNPRWKGIQRGYSAADVVRLRGSIPIEHTLAKRGAEKLWTGLFWSAIYRPSDLLMMVLSTSLVPP